MSEEKKEPLPPAEGIGPPLRPTGVKMPDDPIMVGRKKTVEKSGFWRSRDRRPATPQRFQDVSSKPVELKPKPQPVKPEKVEIKDGSYYSDNYTEESWSSENKDLVVWGSIVAVGIVLYVCACIWFTS